MNTNRRGWTFQRSPHGRYPRFSALLGILAAAALLALTVPQIAAAGALGNLIITEVNPGYHDDEGLFGDRVEIFNKGAETVDLRGLIIEDWDGPTREPFVDWDDIDNAMALLDPGEFCVIFFHWAGANPYFSPANAAVFSKTYGLDVVSYSVHERVELSDYDDQAILVEYGAVVDAVAWSNRDGSSSEDEASQLTELIGVGAWSGVPAELGVATDYLSAGWSASPDNEYEVLAVDFGFISASETGSLQRRHDGERFVEGAGGADAVAHFVVSNDMNFGDPTPRTQRFKPGSVPDLLITEVAPNVRVTNTTGDTVEIYNAGTAPVDLYGIIITDLDPSSHEEDLPGEEEPLISADIGQGVIMLAPGDIAVAVGVDSRLSPQPYPTRTAYGWLIYWPGGSAFNTEGDQVALITRDGGDLIDSLVYLNSDLSSFDSDDKIKDMVQDTDALTASTGGFGFVPSQAAGWNGSDNLKGSSVSTALAALASSAVIFTFGYNDGGSIQRITNATGFIEGSPDGRAQFEVLAETSWGLRPEDQFGVVLAMPAVYFRAGSACKIGRAHV